MDNTRIEGYGHQVKGAIKETFGKLIGDAKLATDGAAERARGVAQSNTDGQVIPGIDTDRITGVGHQFKGQIKEGLGYLFGDTKFAADGSAEQVVGKAQNEAGSARDEAREAGAKVPTGRVDP
jgi:uncharacterized protein YjbJ (UPF0337 family)